jgi:hypothetical protein
MFKSLLIGACLLAALAACASTPQSAPHAASNVACSSPTASGAQARLSPGQCRAYSGADLERTGEVNVGEALRMLDPEVTLQH